MDENHHLEIPMRCLFPDHGCLDTWDAEVPKAGRTGAKEAAFLVDLWQELTL